MPLFLDTSRSTAPLELRASNCVTIGFINNMPDPAFEATERQFSDLIRTAASDVVVRLLLFTIPEVPRSDFMRQELGDRYRDICELWDTHLDGLIVSGTEPVMKNLKDEPYWDTLTQVIDWAGDNTASSIWSCLAAHAAVLHTEGIERRALGEKLFGVFDCEAVDLHPMTSDAGPGVRVPHSRLNELPERALAASGYRILTRSAGAGVDMFARHDRSFQLFLQGHLEYEATTLLREYRRDVGRFLRRERESYPALPQGYFDDEAAAIAVAFRERAIADRRHHLIASFPLGSLESGLATPWRHCAAGIYEKWLGYLRGRKAEQRPRAAPLRRAWRDWPRAGRRSAPGDSREMVEDG
jgi:homoserine O-succinyltransferase/O-acetyltransferase